LSRLKGRFVCVWNCLIFFVGEYSSVWPEIYRVLSHILWRFLCGISRKNYFGKQTKAILYLKLVKLRPTFQNFSLGPHCAENFTQVLSEILGKPKAILYQNSLNFALHSEILVWVRIALKKFTQVLSYVVCIQVRKHVHKQITKRRYGGEKLGRSVFRKPVLFTLGLGLTTVYCPGILEWNFYTTFVTVSSEFWLRFEP